MSKKSYKRNQNRLYREIKRRIVAENKLLMPIKYEVRNCKIDTIATREKIKKFGMPDYMIDFDKKDMTYRIADKLREDGYIVFYTKKPDDDFLLDYVEIEARLNVVREENRR